MRSARRLRGGERKSTRTVLIFANVKLYNTVMLSTATVLSRRVTFALIDLDEPLTGAPATIHGAVTALVPWHDYMRSPRVGLSRHFLSFHFPIAVLGRNTLQLMGTGPGAETRVLVVQRTHNVRTTMGNDVR